MQKRLLLDSSKCDGCQSNLMGIFTGKSSLQIGNNLLTIICCAFISFKFNYQLPMDCQKIKMKSLQFEINQKSFLDCAMFRSLQLKTAQELRYNDNPLFFRVQHFLIFVFGLSNALLSNSMNFLILQVFPRFWCLWIVPRLIEIHTNPQKIQDFLKTPLNERKQSKIKKIVYNKLIEKISLLWVNLLV